MIVADRDVVLVTEPFDEAPGGTRMDLQPRSELRGRERLQRE